MSPFDLLKLTFVSLRSNLLRSGLTSLGVFMGVAAVSATLQVRTISSAIIAQKLLEREAPQMLIYPTWTRDTTSPQEIKAQDIEYLRQKMTGWRSITGSVTLFSFQEILANEETAQTDGVAVQLDFLQTSGRALLQGRFFSPLDFAKYRPVAVIDQFLAQSLFPDSSPLHQTVYVDGRTYTVIGVIETKQSSQSQPKGLILIPFPLYNALTGKLTFEQIAIRPQQIEDLKLLGEEAKSLLNQRFGESFDSWNNIDDVQEQQQLLNMVSLALLAVAAIALLVGGVGIANISIASILERTPEIGLRRAIGATKIDIMAQFILEAIFVSLLGGSVAIASVHGVTVIIADKFKLPYEFDQKTAIFALGSALGVGVGASFWPALRASQLDPVKALRNN
jgi:putative ABC transport system permease protein